MQQNKCRAYSSGPLQTEHQKGTSTFFKSNRLHLAGRTRAPCKIQKPYEGLEQAIAPKAGESEY